MIPNKDCNSVYFSELLRKDLRLRSTCGVLTDILRRYEVSFDFLTGTKDIWCRDYMPVQVGKDRFVQFRYTPSYLKAYPELRTDPTTIHTQCGITPVLSDINLDGGNIVHWRDKAILTDRLLDENPQYTRTGLIRNLEELLQVEVILIPQIKSDMTGHVDGMLRFVDADTILGQQVTT